MLDVSSKLVDIALKQFEAGGLDVATLAEGLQLPGLHNRNAFAEWNDLAIFCARAVESLGGAERLADLSEFAAVSALPEGQLLMALSPDVVTGVHLINRLADATFGPALRYPPLRRIGPNRFHLRLSLSRRHRFQDGRAYFHGMLGTLRAASKYAGLEAASVRAAIEPFQADYEVELPRSALPVDEPIEGAVKGAFVRHWEQALRRVRREMLELREAELRARESEAFAKLSSAVARRLLEQQAGAPPQLAAAAIQSVLNCTRVAITRVGASGATSMGAVGPIVRNLRAIEIPVGDGLLRVEADV